MCVTWIEIRGGMLIRSTLHYLCIFETRSIRFGFVALTFASDELFHSKNNGWLEYFMLTFESIDTYSKKVINRISLLGLKWCSKLSYNNKQIMFHFGIRNEMKWNVCHQNIQNIDETFEPIEARTWRSGVRSSLIHDSLFFQHIRLRESTTVDEFSTLTTYGFSYAQGRIHGIHSKIWWTQENQWTSFSTIDGHSYKNSMAFQIFNEWILLKKNS